jgi:hypothetical protein
MATLVIRAHSFPSHLFWMMAIRSWYQLGRQVHLALLRMGYAVIVKVSAAPASSSAAIYIAYAFTDRPGSSGTVALTQLVMHPNTSISSTSSAPLALQPAAQNSRAGDTVADRGRSAQRHEPSSPRPPRHTGIEVVISSRRTCDLPVLEVPDSQGCVRRKSSPAYDGERCRER